MTLLVIGFDGLDYELSREYGLSFVERGTLRQMTSLYQATVPSWTSIYTGMKRHDHRVGYGWRDWLFNQVPTVRVDKEEKDPPIYPVKYRDLPLVWRDINEAGLSVCLYGMPLTFPPFHVNGWTVSGFPCLQNPKKIGWPVDIILALRNYPPDIFQMLDPKYISHFHTLKKMHHKLFHRMGGPKLAVQLIQRRLDHLFRIWSRKPTDVAFIGFSFLDHVGHIAVINLQQQETMYKLVEWAIEETVNIVKPDKTLIVSDHGGHVTTPYTKNGVHYRYFDHTEKGVIFVEGDSLNNRVRHEYDVKAEILRLIG